MARPKPTVLLEHKNAENFKIEQILESDAIWAVFYNNKPFNLKSKTINKLQIENKYKKVSFSNAGHACRLSKQLNKLFNTNLFTVVKLTTGIVIQ